MVDHDQRFKSLLKTFFAEFFETFFPVWADRFDFSSVDWLEQEVFTDPPRGERRSLDLVARMSLHPGVPPPVPTQAIVVDRCLTLIHVEIESQDTVAPLRPRMLSYYEQLRRQHGLPVLPIALYLRVGLDGVGWDVYEESYWDHRLVSFTYAYVGLPALDGEQYVAGPHLLGVALTALTRVPATRRAVVHAEALQRLAEARENDYRRYLLLDCLEAYARLDEEQAEELQTLLRTERYQGAQAMAMTTYEKGQEQGLQQGLQQGLEQGQRGLLRKLLEGRFGPLNPRVSQHLDSLSSSQLEAIALAVLTARSLQELGLEDV
ncbi:DUF4351 domain-containing protein [Singulisphaera rosea]